MGSFLNPTNDKFIMALNSPIYVDKSNLISFTNRVVATEQRYLCVSRPRRFGKSMAANMLAAYYSRGCDSRELFQRLKISENECFEKYLNQYDVIMLNMQEFLSRTQDIMRMLERLKRMVIRDMKKEYPDVDYFDTEDVIQCMQDVYTETNRAFIIIIDEWDCVLREYKQENEAQKIYLDFLRDFLKDKGYIHLVYMTGILPIKKYGSHSALNMFDNYWNQTETFEALKMYIEMNYEGLKDAVIGMMAGARIPINIRNFTNDMTTFHSYEDILTLLVHLGYLGYDFETKEVFIPNSEVSDEYISAVRAVGWGEVNWNKL